MISRSGFTVLELLVAVGSSLLILAAVGSFSRAQGRTLDRESQRLELREASRRVLAMIARELRGAGFAPLQGGFDGRADGLAVAGRDHIEIRSDLHGTTAADPPDGRLDVDSDERIGFSLSSTRGTVSESVGRQTLPLTLDSTVPPAGLVFRYFDARGREIVPGTGSELSTGERARVCRVSARLVVQNRGGGSVVAEVSSMLRNRALLPCE